MGKKQKIMKGSGKRREGKKMGKTVWERGREREKRKKEREREGRREKGRRGEERGEKRDNVTPQSPKVRTLRRKLLFDHLSYIPFSFLFPLLAILRFV